MHLTLASHMSGIADPLGQELCRQLTADGVHTVAWYEGSDRVGALRSGAAQVGWVCGLLHASLAAAGEWPFRAFAAPVMADARYGGQPVYFGEVIVNSSSRYRRFSHLAGTRFAFNEPASLSGYRTMLERLAADGHGLDWFGSTVASGSHVRSIELVAAARADCAVIDSTVLDMVAATRPSDVAGIRVIERIGPYPAPPLVIGDDVPTETRHELLSALCDDDGIRGLLGRWRIERFSPVSDDAYAELTWLEADRPAISGARPYTTPNSLPSGSSIPTA